MKVIFSEHHEWSRGVFGYIFWEFYIVILISFIESINGFLKACALYTSFVADTGVASVKFGSVSGVRLFLYVWDLFIDLWLEFKNYDFSQFIR